MNLTDYPTPRTNSRLYDIGETSGMDPHSSGDWTEADFSRQLEREAAAWRAVAESMADELRDLAWLAGPANDPSPNDAQQAIEAFDALKSQLNEKP